MKKPVPFAIFLGIALVHLAAILAADASIERLTKVLLLPALAVWFWLETASATDFSKKPLLGGLLFSWLGDVLLMFVSPERPNFFLFGLAAFLAAHVFYIFAFRLFPLQKGAILTKKPLAWAAVTAYLSGFLWFLWPSLPTDFVAPVVAYALTISAMGLFSLDFFEKTDARWARWIVGGALFFIASDSILAVNKFARPVPMGDFWIMLTYVFGQTGIAFGFARALNEKV